MKSAAPLPAIEDLLDRYGWLVDELQRQITILRVERDRLQQLTREGPLRRCATCNRDFAGQGRQRVCGSCRKATLKRAKTRFHQKARKAE